MVRYVVRCDICRFSKERICVINVGMWRVTCVLIAGKMAWGVTSRTCVDMFRSESFVATLTFRVIFGKVVGLKVFCVLYLSRVPHSTSLGSSSFLIWLPQQNFIMFTFFNFPLCDFLILTLKWISEEGVVKKRPDVSGPGQKPVMNIWVPQNWAHLIYLLVLASTRGIVIWR